MKPSIVAVTVAALTAGSAMSLPAFAQQPPAPPQDAQQNTRQDMRRGMDHDMDHGMDSAWRPSAADRVAFANARVATIHARLALTAEQEKLWPPVESVLKDLTQKHAERQEQMRAEQDDKAAPPDAIERLRRSADFMAQAGADLKRLADAAQPLYEKLDDAQKRRLQRMVRYGMRERVHDEMHRRNMRRLGEWRERYRHWRDGEQQVAPGKSDREPYRDDPDDEDDMSGDQPQPRGERL